MKLATLRTGKGTTTATLAVGAESYAPLPYSNVGELLADPGWRSVVHTQASAAEQDAKLINASTPDAWKTGSTLTRPAMRHRKRWSTQPPPRSENHEQHNNRVPD